MNKVSSLFKKAAASQAPTCRYFGTKFIATAEEFVSFRLFCLTHLIIPTASSKEQLVVVMLLLLLLLLLLLQLKVQQRQQPTMKPRHTQVKVEG